MNHQGPFLFLVVLLFIAGIGTASFRHQTYRIPLLPGEQQTVWQVEARIEFLALGRSTQIFLTLPPEQNGFQPMEETGAAPGFGFSVEQRGTQRRAHWTKRQASGVQTLFYKLELVQDASRDIESIPPEPLVFPRWDEPYRTAQSQVIEALLPITADAHSMAVQLIGLMQRQPVDQNVSLLRDRYEDPELLARLLQSAGIAARRVQVLELEDGRRRQSLTEHIQVWRGDRWSLYHPVSGPVTNTENLLLWQTETPAVLEVVGGTNSRVSFSMISQSRSMLELAEGNRDPGFALSLYSLPIAEQGMFKLIMLLPVGALVVVIMRILVGIRTSGTFMPVLIALAFLQTDLLPGLASFLLVVGIGLLIRSYLSSLNLLLVARIATLVILVIGIISVFSVVSYQLGLIGGLTITFFPMIILAWTIERMSIIWEEEGPKEVVVQGGGSLLVATLAFLLMDQPLVRHLAFNFPELHLSILALVMIVGRYTGYRLLELGRFASFENR
ncbi:MAG: inactive transglutaminase family protein [Pseudomonadota bacterium]